MRAAGSLAAVGDAVAGGLAEDDLVEPAGAAATAALTGPLREELRGKRVALIVCGSNIDAATYARYIGAAEQARLGGG